MLTRRRISGVANIGSGDFGLVHYEADDGHQIGYTKRDKVNDGRLMGFLHQLLD